MKPEAIPACSSPAQGSTNGAQPGATGAAVGSSRVTGADASTQEAGGQPVLSEAAEHRYYPTELSDEELMNLDFAGC